MTNKEESQNTFSQITNLINLLSDKIEQLQRLELENCNLHIENTMLRDGLGIAENEKVIKVHNDGTVIVDSPAGQRRTIKISSQENLDLIRENDRLHTKLRELGVILVEKV